MPVDEFGDAYQKLWRQKLLVTPGEIARTVHLQGNVGVESAMSVYRKPRSNGSDYWVTATQASTPLWACVAPDAKPRVDPNSIKIVRLDAPLPESTASVVHKVWVAMLLQARKPPKSNVITLDSSTEIFSAVGPNGKLLRGQLQGFGKGNTEALNRLATSLLGYCDTPESQRADAAQRIEKDAEKLLRRL